MPTKWSKNKEKSEERYRIGRKKQTRMSSIVLLRHWRKRQRIVKKLVEKLRNELLKAK